MSILFFTTIMIYRKHWVYIFSVKFIIFTLYKACSKSSVSCLFRWKLRERQGAKQHFWIEQVFNGQTLFPNIVTTISKPFAINAQEPVYCTSVMSIICQEYAVYSPSFIDSIFVNIILLSREKLISDILLWTSSYRRAKAG